MAKLLIHHFPNVENLVGKVCANWAVELQSSNVHRPFKTALSGGRVSVRLFEQMVRDARLKGLRIANLEFYWADERLVPPSDPESNYFTARQHLFEPLGIDDAKIHRIKGEKSAEEAVADANADLPDPKSLSLVFLGMGEDGHVASLFPGQNPQSPLGGSYAFVIGPKPPPRRVTMTYETILAAERIWVLITGEGKEEAFQNSLEGKTPLGRILQSRPDTEIFRGKNI